MEPFKQPGARLSVGAGQDRLDLGPGAASPVEAVQLAQLMAAAASGLWLVDLGLTPVFERPGAAEPVS